MGPRAHPGSLALMVRTDPMVRPAWTDQTEAPENADRQDRPAHPVTVAPKGHKAHPGLRARW